MTVGLRTGQGMPSREGDMTIEGHGMDPIPESSRYGSVSRVFTVWFTPNLVPAAFFLGTLAAASFIGLGFWLAAAASVPRKNAAGTRFGVNQTVKTRVTDP